jgi:hypothetical protein
MYHDSFKDADGIQNLKGRIRMLEKNPETLWDWSRKTYYRRDSNRIMCGFFAFTVMLNETTNQKFLAEIEKCKKKLSDSPVYIR